ncbi:Hypothetical_protein [Hexamita inflata]|uniref:Hypothetical_protein n=1 Tax=Hexamita inflata TaxID=28002 RepID=A0AA86QJS4_9EUKA|nr:Hypothetical protein HINF_LOCUS37390 [Hexamita inflata]CAI9954379.1 Hypothetical protein HINF_LOCUS42024 [Hexamita inflata]CAI9954842.1 Hypothetical protein HINF_LOCUS42487 [Hexamita inflata]
MKQRAQSAQVVRFRGLDDLIDIQLRPQSAFIRPSSALQKQTVQIPVYQQTKLNQKQQFEKQFSLVLQQRQELIKNIYKQKIPTVTVKQPIKQQSVVFQIQAKNTGFTQNLARQMQYKKEMLKIQLK